MDLGTALNIAGSLQAQSLDAAVLTASLRSMKSFQDFQVNIVTQLLASLPSVNPDGVGGVVDIRA
jgi:hypothetical protein